MHQEDVSNQILHQFSIPELPKSIKKLMNSMINNSNKQQVYPPQSKLHTPLIYDKLMRINKIKQNSLHTLCNALHIFEGYLQSTQKQNANKESNYCQQIDTSMLDKITVVCLEISEDINQFIGKKKQTKLKRQIRQLEQIKIEVMKKLDWNFNYVTFVNIVQQFFSWFNDQLALNITFIPSTVDKKFKQINTKSLQPTILRQIEIQLQRFNFLYKNALQCAWIVIERVLKNNNTIEIQIQSIIQKNHECQSQTKDRLYSILKGQFKVIIVKFRTNVEKTNEQSSIKLANNLNNLSQKQIEAQIQGETPLTNKNLNLTSVPNHNSLKQFINPFTNISLNLNNTKFAILKTNNKNKPPLSQFRMKIVSDKKIQQYFKPAKLFSSINPQQIQQVLEKNCQINQDKQNRDMAEQSIRLQSCLRLP